jgi:hypothetical protein
MDQANIILQEFMLAHNEEESQKNLEEGLMFLAETLITMESWKQIRVYSTRF